MGDWLLDLTGKDCPTPPGADRDDPRTQMALRRAMNLHRDVAAFESRWVEPAAGPQLPPFSWAQLERQLVDLTDSPLKAAMARDLVSATRKMARFKPPEMVLREILCLTWALLDEGFEPEFGSTEGWAEAP